MAVTSLGVELRRRGNNSHDLKKDDELTILIEIRDNKLKTRMLSTQDPKNHYWFDGGFVYEAVIRSENQTLRLDELNNNKLLNLSKQKKITLKFKNLISNTEIVLPKDMSNNLIAYMSGGRRKDSDCQDFVNDLFFGCGTQALHTLKMDYVQLSENPKLKAGQAILLSDSLKNEQGKITAGNFHYAIFLCDDLYISVFGSGSIYITTLEQLKLCFRVATTYHITPILQTEIDQKAKIKQNQIQEPKFQGAKKLCNSNNSFLPSFSFKNLAIAATITVGVVAGICYKAQNK